MIKVEAIRDQMIADLSGKETQASPVLDLSDVIERSRKGTLAETFMRLGAGVAGGDISKGIAGAADAASKGRQELSRLEMAERIAQTRVRAQVQISAQAIDDCIDCFALQAGESRIDSNRR